MLNFSRTDQADEHVDSGGDLGLLAWLADYSLDGGMQPALAEDLFSVLDPDGGMQGALSPVDDAVEGVRDAAPATDAGGVQAVAHGVTGFGYSAGAENSGYVFGAVGPHSNGIFTSDAEIGFPDAPSPATASNGDHGGGTPAAQDLIFLDDFSSARGGIPGKPGGGGGDDGGTDSSDSGVLSEYTSGSDDGSGYNIQIDFKGTWTTELQEAFIQSAELFSYMITGDIADVFFRGKIIDDIVIKAELKEIDGEGGILGMAGPTAIRTDGYLPAAAVMQFDIADASNFDSMGLWEEIVLHEMMHSIGFGTVWSYLDLIDNTDPDNPFFKGELAKSANGGEYMQLEADGGSGTALSHWDDATYTTEIMTGYLSTNGEVSSVEYDLNNGSVSLTDDQNLSDLSNMTIASLEDLGYETIWPDASLIA